MCATRFRHRGHRPARERGIYSIEYAFVFLLFFGMIYSIVCYSVVFAFRSGLQNAAEDGARAGLRYQHGPSVQQSLVARRLKAEEVARHRSESWKPADANLLIQSDVCQIATGVCLQSGGAPDCAAPGWEQRCHIRVSVALENLDQVLPPIPFPMPDRIVGQAYALMGWSTP